MVKRCAWGTCKSDSRYPERLFIKDEGITVRFRSFPSEKKHKEQSQGMLGYGHVVVPKTSSVRRTATYAVCILLEETVRLKITLTRFQLQPAR